MALHFLLKCVHNKTNPTLGKNSYIELKYIDMFVLFKENEEKPAKIGGQNSEVEI